MNADAGRRVLPVLLALLLVVTPLAWYLPFWVTGVFAGLVLIRAALVWQRRPLPPRWLLVLALLVPVGFLWLTLKTLVGREGGVALLVLLAGFKALETGGLRDWRVLLALGFFLAAMPLLFDQSPAAAVWLVVSLVALTWAMARLAGNPPRAGWRQTATALGLSLPLMLVLFFIMPRLSGPLWSMPPSRQTAVTGLADDMAPGSISRIIPANTPVFNVVFDGAPPARRDFYWRVRVFDRFDGVRWYEAGTIREETLQLLGGQPYRYRITVKPERRRLPVLDYPAENAPDPAQLQPGLTWSSRRSTAEETIRLPAEGRSGARLAEALDPARLALYLQLPPGNPQARALAARLRQRSADDRILLRGLLDTYRSQPFRYTLTPPALPGQIVDGFLFGSRQGFCEHFAGSLAFLARAAGLPARVVVGYQGGRFNPDGGFWQVRSADAHAWVEVWLPSEGAWLRVDPTATVSPDRIAAGAESALPVLQPTVPVIGGAPPAWLGRWRQMAEAWSFRWQRWVVGYDADRQRQLFRRLGLGDEVSAPVVLRGLAVGMLLGMVPLLWWWRRRPVADPLASGWMAVRRRLRRAGIALAPSDGPQDVLGKAAGLAEADRIELEALTQRYIDWRYRGQPASAAEIRTWLRAVRRFRPRQRAA